MESPWLISIISGLISGTIVSVFFYVLAGKDLRKKALELKRADGVVLRALKDSGAKVIWDDGVPVRLEFTLHAEAGNYELKGGDANFTHDRVLHAGSGTYETTFNSPSGSVNRKTDDETED